MNKAKKIYKLAWVIWIIGALLITASWFSMVTPTWGWVGFVISLLGFVISGYSHWVARQERRSRVEISAVNSIASFDDLEKVLKEATRLLDQATEGIRKLQLEPEKNVRRISEAMVSVSEIRSEVYTRRPDLMPANLRKK
jgi:hypothetical protein